MKFYNIADEYINFLRTFDSKVSENKQESRPYIGVVIEIEEMKYYAPFTSPKAKHRKMKNGKDFRKIQGGDYKDGSKIKKTCYDRRWELDNVW